MAGSLIPPACQVAVSSARSSTHIMASDRYQWRSSPRDRPADLGTATVWRRDPAGSRGALGIFESQGINAVLTNTRWHPFGLAAITLGFILFGHLALVLLHTAYRTFRQRRKHREFVELLAASLKEEDHGLQKTSRGMGGTRVLPVEDPLAYCLPAINQPLTVVSQGLLEELTPNQLGAVLAHESAHLSQRHDLLRLAFQAWHKAAPWFPATGVAVSEVSQLTEIMADEYALTHHERDDLITALARTLHYPDASAPAAESHPTGEHREIFSRRIRRLTNPDDQLSSCRVSLVIILAVLLVTVPAVVSVL